MPHHLGLCFLLFCLTALHRTCYSQELQLVKTWGAQEMVAMEKDMDNNFVCVGRFIGPVDMDPGPSVFYLNSAYTFKDVFIMKLDSAGNMLWAKKIGGDYTDFVTDLEIDENGNVYIVGSFSTTVDFDPGPNSYPRSSEGDTDIYILKLDSNGDFVWVKTIGSYDSDIAYSLAVDNESSIYIGGRFGSSCYDCSIDLDPGEEYYWVQSTDFQGDGFVLKLDESGNFQWAHVINDSAYSAEVISCAEIDAGNNLIIAGDVTGLYDIYDVYDINETDTINLDSLIVQDIFISSLNQDGQVNWFRTIETGDPMVPPDALEIDNQGHIHLVGDYYYATNFTPQLETDLWTDSTDIGSYIYECDALGNFQSVGIYQSNMDIVDIEIAETGQKFLTGRNTTSTDVDFSAATDTLHSSEGTNFLIKYGSSNQLIWAHAFGLGTSAPRGVSVQWTSDDMLYAAGVIGYNADFDLQEGENIIETGFNANCYIAKYYASNQPVDYDFDGDEDVDMTDFLILIENFGCFTCPELDMDGDGIITFNDLMMTIANLD